MGNCHLRYATPEMEHAALVDRKALALSLDDARGCLRGLRRAFQQNGYTVRPLWTLDEGFEATRGTEQVSVWIYINETVSEEAEEYEYAY